MTYRGVSKPCFGLFVMHLTTTPHQEVKMDDDLKSKRLCSVCREEMTTIHADIGGQVVHVCEKCLETAKQNFIWICMGCGSVFIRPKSLVIKGLNGELRRAYEACENEQIIQGIDMCIECSPEEIVEYVAAAKSGKNGGHC
jgi:hypothetical protein